VTAGRLLFIDGLRGIAAVMVMLFHLVNRTRAAALTHLGYLGVAIFFVLSGFVIAMVVGERTMSGAFLGRFALRRAIRLDIPYWASIALVLGLGIIAGWFGVPKEGFTAPQVLAHMFYLQTILGFPEMSPNYWTLCLEIQFYLALILLTWGAQALHLSRTAFLSGFLALFTLSVLDNAGLVSSPRGFMLPYWWAFALGAITYWTLQGDRKRWLMIAFVILAASSFAKHGEWCLTAAVTAGALLVAGQIGAMGKWLSSAPFQFMGRISYSLYLLHPLIGWSAQSLALRYFNQWGALIIGIAAAIGSAWLAYRLIERPSIILSHRVQLS
jgi:peptidoglycan/LPS O-acetylase OafA/YrhL